MGGGAILDPFASGKKRHAPQRLAMLAALQGEDVGAVIAALFAAAPDGLALSQIAAAFNLKPADADACWSGADLIRVGGKQGEFGFDRKSWQRGTRNLLDAVTRFHAAQPDRRGIEPAQLRADLETRCSAKTFNLQLDRLLEQKILVRDGSCLRLASRRVEKSGIDMALWLRIEPHLRAAELEPRGLREIAQNRRLPEAQARAEMHRFAGAGKVVQFEKDVYLLSETVAHFAAVIKQMAAENAKGEVTLAKFRDRIGMGRRYAVKLLEFYDRIGLTRFIGAAHRLRIDAQF